MLNKLDYSNKLVGQVKQEFQLPKNFIKKNLEKLLYKAVKDYIFNIVKNPPCYGIVNFLKDYNHYFIKLNGDFCHGYSNDRVEYTESSEDESSSGSESESENKFD